jgi:copper(I)-binding protein
VTSRRSFSAVVLAAAVVATGCGAGRHTETDKERASPYIAYVSAGSIAVRAIRIAVADNPASGSPQAYLLATLVNRGAETDSLVSATVSGSAVGAVGANGQPGPVNVALPPSQIVQIGDPDLGATDNALGIGVLQEPLQVGTTTTVTFTFQTAGTVTVDVPVMTSSDVGTTASAAPVTAAG